MRTLRLCVCLGAISVACQKPPSNTTAAVGAAPLAFLEFLPEETQAFGYVHLDKPWTQSIEPFLAVSHKAIVADLEQMAKRRFGAQIAGLRSIAFAMIDKQPVFFFGGMAGELKGGGDDKLVSRDGAAIIYKNKYAVAQTERLWMVGEPLAVEHALAARRSPKRLTVSQASWTTWAIAEANHAPAMVTLKRAPIANLATPGKHNELADVELAAAVATARGLHVAMVTKPGRGRSVEAALRTVMNEASSRIDDIVAKAADRTAQSELLAALAQHYGHAWLNGIALRGEADRVVIDVPWRKPQWDVPFVPPPTWSARAIAPEEFVAAQINLGGPALEQLLRWSDVLGRPLDRTALQRQLTDIFARHIGASYRDFVAVGVSGGKDALFVSFVAPPANSTPKPQPSQLSAAAANEVAIEATRWGTAVARAKERRALKLALAKPPQELPLLAASKVANGEKDQVFLRGAVDLTRLPSEIAEVPSQIPLVSIEFSAGRTGFQAEVVTHPGKSAGVIAMVNMAKAVMKGQSEDAYQRRASLRAREELIAIFQYHQAAAFDRIAVTDLGGDRLRISLSSAEMGERYVRFIAPAMLTGVAAAIAIPAFIKYSAAASKQPLQLAQ